MFWISHELLGNSVGLFGAVIIYSGRDCHSMWNMTFVLGKIMSEFVKLSFDYLAVVSELCGAADSGHHSCLGQVHECNRDDLQ